MTLDKLCRSGTFWLVLIVILFAAVICLSLAIPTSGQSSAQARSAQSALLSAPEPIYSADPNDSWNRIFYFLFSRRIQARLSDEFPEGAPFVDKPVFAFRPKFRASTRVFERTEIGDRMVLNEPAYSAFVAALQDALKEDTPRAPAPRAVMQSDVWAAHDILSYPFSQPELEERRRRVLALLSQLMLKIALTPEEIQSVPDNYAAAVHRLGLPDLFQKGSGWIEIRWFPYRMHDEAAGFRRFVRVFLKPAHPPRDLRKFLNTLPDSPDSTDMAAQLDGVALITQLLAIDNRGELHPTRLASEIQVRVFNKTAADRAPLGGFRNTEVQVAEISRKLLLDPREAGGLLLEGETTPFYFPMAGNDYGFAPTQSNTLEPIQVKLRTRCMYCHDNDLRSVMSFGIARPPHFHVPRVRQLDAAGHEAADFVIAQKRRRAEFAALREYFRSSRPASLH